MNDYKLLDLRISQSHSFQSEITEKMMQQFTKMSGDTNPLHSDPDFAIQKGFSSNVVFGMLTASFYSTLIGVYLPGKYALLQGIDISFHHPVYPGESLTIYGEICHIHEAFGQVEIKAFIRNQAAKKISKAKIKVGFTE